MVQNSSLKVVEVNFLDEFIDSHDFVSVVGPGHIVLDELSQSSDLFGAEIGEQTTKFGDARILPFEFLETDLII